MTKAQPVRSCDECRYSGSWHYRENPDTLEMEPYRCPNYLAAEAAATAQKMTADAHTEAFKAAKQIIRDAADHMPELNGNQLRELFEAAQIDSPVIGAAFSACAREGVIEPTGRYIPSTEQTTRHRIAVWRSLRYRGSAA